MQTNKLITYSSQIQKMFWNLLSSVICRVVSLPKKDPASYRHGWEDRTSLYRLQARIWVHNKPTSCVIATGHFIGHLFLTGLCQITSFYFHVGTISNSDRISWDFLNKLLTKSCEYEISTKEVSFIAIKALWSWYLHCFSRNFIRI